MKRACRRDVSSRALQQQKASRMSWSVLSAAVRAVVRRTNDGARYGCGGAVRAGGGGGGGGGVAVGVVGGCVYGE